MDEHVGYRGVAVANGVLHVVPDVMAGAHREVGIHADVDVHIELRAHLAQSAFLHIEHARHALRDRAYAVLDLLRRCRVHDFVDRGDQ